MKLHIAFGTSSDLPEEYQVIDFSKDTGYEAPYPDDVLFQLSLDIGVEGSGRTDIFQCVIATEKNRYLIKDHRHTIFFYEYRYDSFRRKIRDMVASCEKDTWNECVVCLRKHFFWEYEGIYKEEDLRKL